MSTTIACLHFTTLEELDAAVKHAIEMTRGLGVHASTVFPRHTIMRLVENDLTDGSHTYDLVFEENAPVLADRYDAREPAWPDATGKAALGDYRRGLEAARDIARAKPTALACTDTCNPPPDLADIERRLIAEEALTQQLLGEPEVLSVKALQDELGAMQGPGRGDRRLDGPYRVELGPPAHELTKNPTVRVVDVILTDALRRALLAIREHNDRLNDTATLPTADDYFEVYAKLMPLYDLLKLPSEETIPEMPF